MVFEVLLVLLLVALLVGAAWVIPRRSWRRGETPAELQRQSASDEGRGGVVREMVVSQLAAADFRQREPRDPVALLDPARGLEDIVQFLAPTPEQTLNQLLANARDDTDPEVRRRSVEGLADLYLDDADALTALGAALADPDPGVRWEAARRLGGAGCETVQALVDDPACPTKLRIDALAYLLADHGPRCQVEWLVGLVEQPQGELAAWGAIALGERGAERAEGPILGLLEWSDPEVRRCAVVALGQLGSRRAVEPLRRLASKGLGWPAEAERAREAIGRIQERLGDVDTGRLSVSAPDEHGGAVSLAPADGGLSPAADDQK